MDQSSRDTLTALDAALADLNDSSIGLDDVPEGWMTCQQWSKALNKSLCVTSRKIKALIEQGKWESKTFRIMTSRRGPYPVPHYRKKP